MTDYEPNGLIKEDREPKGCKGGNRSDDLQVYKHGGKLAINS